MMMWKVKKNKTSEIQFKKPSFTWILMDTGFKLFLDAASIISMNAGKTTENHVSAELETRLGTKLVLRLADYR